MTTSTRWLRLHEAVALLAYGKTGEQLDAWAYPGASVGLTFFEACADHPALKGDRELPRWLHYALGQFGLLKGSDSADAPPLRKLLHTLQHKLNRHDINRPDREAYSRTVFAELSRWRADLIDALGHGELKAYGLRADLDGEAGAAPIPHEVFQAPITVDEDGHLRCGLSPAKPILWRDLVVKRADLDRIWPEGKDPPVAPVLSVSETPQPPAASDPAALERNHSLDDAGIIELLKGLQLDAKRVHGKPLDVRSLGRALKERHGISARKADRLSRQLPEDLRNRART